jgi:hypothetical protein
MSHMRGKSARLTIPLAVAGGLMIAAGLPVALMAVATPSGATFSLGGDGLGGIVAGLVIALAGVETLRRRNYGFALVTPVLLALACTGYGLATGQIAVAGAVVLYLVVALLIASDRRVFAGQTAEPA